MASSVSFRPTAVDVLGVVVAVLALLAGLVPGIVSAPAFAASVDIDQCANDNASGGGKNDGSKDPCDWVNGNLNAQNSVYREGDSVAFRIGLTGLTPGAAYEVPVNYDIINGFYVAYDQLTAWDRTETGDPIDGYDTGPDALAPGDEVRVTVPRDPRVAGSGVTPLSDPAPDLDASLWGGAWETRAAPVEYLTGGEDVSGATSTVQSEVVFRFVADNPTAVIAWGGHIATRQDWTEEVGTPTAPASTNGSPYHMRIGGDLGEGPGTGDLTYTFSSLGNQDRSLKAGAVLITPGDITLSKSEVLGEGQLPSDAPIAGATFVLLDSTDTPTSFSCTTGTTGACTITGVPPGDYTAVETVPPPGYVLTDEQIAFSINDQGQVDLADENGDRNFENPRVTISIDKTDDQGAALAGATFSLTKTAGDPAFAGDTCVSDGAGDCTFDGDPLITPGTYTVAETDAPDGYSPSTATATFTVDTAGAVTQTDGPTTFVNIADPDVTVTKSLSDGGAAIPDGGSVSITFGLFADGAATEATPLDTCTATISSADDPAEGSCDFLGVAPGTYDIRETDAPAGYLDATGDLGVTVNADGTVDYEGGNDTVVNDPFPDVMVTKLLAGGGDASIAGTQFALTNDGAGPSYSCTVADGDDSCIFLGVAPGDYTASETTPPAGYLGTTTTYDVEVKPDGNVTVDGQDQPLQFTNRRFPEVVVRKVDADGASLAGATLELRDGSGASVATCTSLADAGETPQDETGLCEFGRIAPGSYTVHELSAPAGYVAPDPATVLLTVVVGDDGQVTISDGGEIENNPNSITITKVIEGTSTGLAGAVFTVTGPDADLASPYTTDGDGKITLGQLDPGTYTVTETKPPAGYTLSGDSPQQFTVADDGTISPESLEFANAPNSITITKVAAGTSTGLAGAVFTIDGPDADLADDYTTDADGKITLGQLVPGTYTVTETKPPAGYTLSDDNPQTFTVAPDGTIDPGSLTFENDPNTFTITKVDADDATTGLAGAVFTVTGPDTDLAASYTTDADGEITLGQLVPGTYTVTETEPPPGYLLSDPASQQFTVADDGTTSPGSLTFTNPPNTITITKTALDGTTGLAGAVFTVDGPDTDLADDYTTDADGEITLGQLVPGTYTVTETKPPAGYTLSGDNSQTFTVADDGTIDPETLNFTNEPNAITITKTALDGTTGLAGAVFSVDGPGEDDPADCTTDAAGECDFGTLAPGTYTVTEEQPPPGYLLSDPVSQDFVVADDGTISPTEGLTFTNPPNELQVAKEGSQAGTPAVDGAVFGLFAFDAAVALEDLLAADPLRTCTSGDLSTGLCSFTLLDPGTYLLTETVAPEYYQGTDAVWLVTVDADTGAVLADQLPVDGDEATTLLDGPVTFVNDPLEPDVAIVKTVDGLADGEVASRTFFGPSAPDQSVTYTYVVTNTGPLPLRDLTIDDDKLGLIFPTESEGDEPIDSELLDCSGVLAPGASCVAEATTTFSVADARELGEVLNVATVRGEGFVPAPTTLTPSGVADTATTAGFTAQALDPTTCPLCVIDDDPALIRFVYVAPPPPPVLEPAVDLVKVVDQTVVTWTEGEPDPVVTYTYQVTNFGDVTLTLDVLQDDQIGTVDLTGGTGTPVVLAPGESHTVTATDTITAADAASGSKVNVATITTTLPNGTDGPTDTDDATVDVIEVLEVTYGIEVDKVAVGVEVLDDGTLLATYEPQDDDDETIDYVYTITNTSSVALSRITLVDDVLGTILDGTEDITLAPGESVTVDAVHLLTDADGEAGLVVNVAEVTGTAVDGTQVSDIDDEVVEVQVVIDVVVEPIDPPLPAPLPATGADGEGLTALAMLLLSVGTGILWIDRRRRRAPGHGFA